MTCPAGQVMFGTTGAAAARCVSVTCNAGSSLRGYNADFTPICEADDVGLPGIPANACPAGQAVVAIQANGVTTCAPVGGGGGQAQLCAGNGKVVGLQANGQIICDCNQDAQCPAQQYCNANLERCVDGCRDDNVCPAGRYCNLDSHTCEVGCRNNAECPAGLSCAGHQCVAGVLITGPGEAYGHHGACNGWNQCGDARTCALWACNIQGFNNVVSWGREGPCTTFNTCHLFFGGCCNGIQWNWGNWCDVAGVTDILCGG
jgi:hypothetical protein